MKTSGKVPTFTYTCKRQWRGVANTHTRTYIRERPLAFHTQPHIRTASSRTSEKARGEFYIFIPRSPFSPPSQPPFPSPSPASRCTNERAISHPCVPTTPAAAAVRTGDAISHSKHPPLFPLASRSPHLLGRASNVLAYLWKEYKTRGSYVELGAHAVRTYVCVRAARSGFNLKNN